MVDQFHWLDATALAVFLATWSGYSMLFDGRFRRPFSVNAQMVHVREAWMEQLLRRDVRVMDAVLIGHSISSATFFASTTIIVLAGLIGVLGSAETVHSAVMNLSVLLRGSALALFELKLCLLVAIFVYAFFKFTWAIRQLNYFTGIVGGAPPPSGGPIDRELSRRMAIILSTAVWQINAGVRAYYFALAVLAWFIHPAVFIGATALVAAVLARRQLFSPTSASIRSHVDHLLGSRSPD